MPSARTWSRTHRSTCARSPARPPPAPRSSRRERGPQARGARMRRQGPDGGDGGRRRRRRRQGRGRLLPRTAGRSAARWSASTWPTRSIPPLRPRSSSTPSRTSSATARPGLSDGSARERHAASDSPPTRAGGDQSRGQVSRGRQVAAVRRQGHLLPANGPLGVPHAAKAITQEETFGPVVALSRFDGSDETAVQLANDSTYGLTASVYSGDIARAGKIAARISVARSASTTTRSRARRRTSPLSATSGRDTVRTAAPMAGGSLALRRRSSIRRRPTPSRCHAGAGPADRRRAKSTCGRQSQQRHRRRRRCRDEEMRTVKAARPGQGAHRPACTYTVPPTVGRRPFFFFYSFLHMLLQRDTMVQYVNLPREIARKKGIVLGQTSWSPSAATQS